MKKVLLFIAVVSIFSFDSCSKCQKCGPVSIDGVMQKVKVCDEDQIKYYETFTSCH